MSLTQLPELDLPAMMAEAVANNTAKGFRDTPVPPGVAMALLHSEVAEATDAWRKWGVADCTELPCPLPADMLPKPEGVGSELADVLIRLLDDCDLYGVDPAELGRFTGRFGIDDGPDSFLVSMNVLHTLIAKASMVLESLQDGMDPENDRFVLTRLFSQVYVYLCQLCEHYGLDLGAEYRRKIDFNKTRPYKHGNKRR